MTLTPWARDAEAWTEAIRVPCSRCGVRLDERHTAIAEGSRYCPDCIMGWAMLPAQQDALARAERRPCGDADGGPTSFGKGDG